MATTVRDMMTSEVTTLDRNDKLAIADNVMTLGRIRHMPVLDDDGRVVGVVSQRDLFRGSLVKALGYGTTGQQKVMNSIVVKEVMSTNLLTVAPDAPLAEAARLMVDNKIGCLPVLDGERLVGILTEGDFVAAAIE